MHFTYQCSWCQVEQLSLALCELTQYCTFKALRAKPISVLWSWRWHKRIPALPRDVTNNDYMSSASYDEHTEHGRLFQTCLYQVMICQNDNRFLFYLMLIILMQICKGHLRILDIKHFVNIFILIQGKGLSWYPLQTRLRLSPVTHQILTKESLYSLGGHLSRHSYRQLILRLSYLTVASECAIPLPRARFEQRSPPSKFKIYSFTTAFRPDGCLHI